MSDSETRLPTVKVGDHTMTRLLIGHNPFKGGSHYSRELSVEMYLWHQELENSLAAFRRCEECGIDTAQFGGDVMHERLSEYARRGGTLQWIATLYGNEHGNVAVGKQMAVEAELESILKVDPEPIGIQHFGEATDQLFLEGKLDEVRERMKRLRDTGLLTGLCTHLPEVAEEAASQDWDIDFYQTSFYTVYSHIGAAGLDHSREVFEDRDRDRMVAVIQQLDKPCLAFKVLGSNRKCGSDAELESALRFAYDSIKDCDVVVLGMWQKHEDQIGQNTALVRKILAERGAG
jgi:hypothetical protein